MKPKWVVLSTLASFIISFQNSVAGPKTYEELYLENLEQARKLYEPVSSTRKGMKNALSLEKYLAMEGAHKEAKTQYKAFLAPFFNQYGSAIPNEEALQLIGACQPLVAFELGTGYWLNQIQERSIALIAFKDPLVDSSDTYREVNFQVDFAIGTPEFTYGTAGLTLFIQHPSPGMALRALRPFRGNRVIFIGQVPSDWQEASYQSDSPVIPQDLKALDPNNIGFFWELSKNFKRTRTLLLPSWPGVTETLTVFERKANPYEPDEPMEQRCEGFCLTPFSVFTPRTTHMKGVTPAVYPKNRTSRSPLKPFVVPAWVFAESDEPSKIEKKCWFPFFSCWNSEDPSE